MTPGEDKFVSMNLDKNLMEIVKLEYAMKKHFIYIDHIDDLKHKETIVREFDKAIRIVETLMNKLKILRKNLR